MTIRSYPDGTTSTSPDGLDTPAPVHPRLTSVMNRALARAGVPTTPEVEALAELLTWRATDRATDGPLSDVGWTALQRLRDVADRLGAA